MNWYKASISLAGGDEETIVMRVLGVSENSALGLLHRWLTYVNAQTADGVTRLLPEDLDRVLRYDGDGSPLMDGNGQPLPHSNAHAYHALNACGWVTLNERGEVCAIDFEKHNSQSAKDRACAAARTAKSKKKKREDEGNGQPLPHSNGQPLPDKRREEYIKENSSSELKENRADDSGHGLVDVAMTPEPDDAPTAREAPRPVDADEVADYLVTLPMLKLTAGQRLEAARAFFDEMEAVGWVSKHGQIVWRWKAAARRWACAWAENNHGAAHRGGQAARPSRTTGTINDRDHSNYDDI